MTIHVKSSEANKVVYTKECGGTAQSFNIYGNPTWTSTCAANLSIRIKSWDPKNRQLVVETYISANHSGSSTATSVYLNVPTIDIYGYNASNAAIKCGSVGAHAQNFNTSSSWNVTTTLGTTTITIPTTVDLRKNFYIGTTTTLIVQLNGINAKTIGNFTTGEIFSLQPTGFCNSTVRISGTSKQVLDSHVRIAGALKPVVGVWTRQGGALKQC